MTIPLSTALHISYAVNAAPITAVKASISTPVRPKHVTVEVIESPPCGISTSDFDAGSGCRLFDGVEGGWRTETSISTPVIPNPGCASGTISAVRLAAMIPAIRETDRTSPFFMRPADVVRREYAVGLENVSVQAAVARREVSFLWVMEVMCTVSEGVRCGSDGWEAVERSEDAAVDWDCSGGVVRFVE